MTTSGSWDFTVSRDDIIEGALRLIGYLGEDQSPTSTQLDQCGMALNLMIRAWQAKGIALWKNQEIVLFPQADRVKYRLGATMQSTHGDYACVFTDYVKTELAAALAAADTAVSVDSSTGLIDGDYVGIETDNGDIHWSTIDTPGSDAFTLDDAIDYAAAIDSHVYAGFDAIVQRPLEIIQVWRRDADENDTPIRIISLDEYRTLSTKTTEANPIVLAPEFLLDDMNVYLWPEPNDMKVRIHMIVKYMFEDFDAAANNPDFPVEWHEALKFNLAIRLAPEYGRTLKQEVVMIAAMSLEDAENSSVEQSSTYFSPDLSSYRRFPSG